MCMQLKKTLSHPFTVGDNTYQFHFGALEAFAYQQQFGVNPRYAITQVQNIDFATTLLQVLYEGIKSNHADVTFEQFIADIALDDIEQIHLFLAKHVVGDKFHDALKRAFDKQTEMVEQALDKMDEATQSANNEALKSDPLADAGSTSITG